MNLLWVEQQDLIWAICPYEKPFFVMYNLSTTVLALFITIRTKSVDKSGKEKAQNQLHTCSGRCFPGCAATPVMKSLVTNGRSTTER